ncbi:MAG: sulfite exporter TauE/SafE family protein [Ilumatobacteraceae bacterium]
MVHNGSDEESPVIAEIAPHTLLTAAFIGLGIGFLSGLLGKGGSAIATPLLAAIGIPPIIAVAAPLPAAIPSTLAASWVYWKERYVDWRVVRWSIGCGIPATIAGAIATRWISGGFLVKLTDVVLIALGIRLVMTTRRKPATIAEPAGLVESTGEGALAVAVALHVETGEGTNTEAERWLLATVAVAVGLMAGLLANSGGFLLAPLYLTVIKLPIRQALASSLAVSAVLAIPGTVVHAALGHIDWTLVLVFGATAVPLSMAGARVALRIDAHRLEFAYGIILILLGGVFLALR